MSSTGFDRYIGESLGKSKKFRKHGEVNYDDLLAEIDQGVVSGTQILTEDRLRVHTEERVKALQKYFKKYDVKKMRIQRSAMISYG